VHLALSDAGLEVGEDGLDVALRIGRPEDAAVITRKIASTKRIVLPRGARDAGETHRSRGP
jgi:hypothetical protein